MLLGALAIAGALYFRPVEAPQRELTKEASALEIEPVREEPPVATTLLPQQDAHFERPNDEVVVMHSGAMQVNVPALPNDRRFRLSTLDAIIETRDASFFVEAREDALVAIFVTAGVVELQVRNGVPRLLTAGERWKPARPAPRKVVTTKIETSEEELEAGLRALSAGDASAAARHFEKVLEVAPDDALAEDAAYGYAVSLLRSERFDEAEEALRRFRARYPRSPRAMEVELFLGWRRWDRHDLDAAEEHFATASSSTAPVEVRSRAQEGLRAVKDRRGMLR
jgi:tetratricopeptide (TPR) repeat protein